MKPSTPGNHVRRWLRAGLAAQPHKNFLAAETITTDATQLFYVQGDSCLVSASGQITVVTESLREAGSTRENLLAPKSKVRVEWIYLGNDTIPKVALKWTPQG